MLDIIKYVRLVNVGKPFYIDGTTVEGILVVGVTSFSDDGETFAGSVAITYPGGVPVGTFRDDWDVLAFEEYHGTVPVA